VMKRVERNGKGECGSSVAEIELGWAIKVHIELTRNFVTTDHTGHDAAKEILLRCTGSKPVSTKPGAPHKACILMYCEKCLKKHYEEDARRIIAQGEQDEWKCPSCRNMCKLAASETTCLVQTVETRALGQGTDLNL